ncbi:MAG: hypothetical protein ISS71_05425 [Phycisphaerae bacterium]|nr:hypothetical protein [Phycisphaerae bacterium]
MTKREIASLVIKLMGVFILIKSIAYVPMTFSGLFTIWRPGVENSGFGWAILLGVIVLVLSVAAVVFSLSIIIFSDKVAARLIKEDNDKFVEVGNLVNKEDVMLVVFSCIGLYLIVTAIPSLIVYTHSILTFYKSCAGRPVYPSGGWYQFSRLIAPVVQIGLGVWLFAGSKGLVKLWHKIRS